MKEEEESERHEGREYGMTYIRRSVKVQGTQKKYQSRNGRYTKQYSRLHKPNWTRKSVSVWNTKLFFSRFIREKTERGGAGYYIACQHHKPLREELYFLSHVEDESAVFLTTRGATRTSPP